MATRRSIRAFPKEQMTVNELGQLLWAAQGVTFPDGKRTAPSAMHKYPLEIAVVIQNVCCLPNGAYRYVLAMHALALLAPAKTGEALLGAAATQAQVQSAAAVFVITYMTEWGQEPGTVLLRITKPAWLAKICFSNPFRWASALQ